MNGKLHTVPKSLVNSNRCNETVSLPTPGVVNAEFGIFTEKPAAPVVSTPVYSSGAYYSGSDLYAIASTNPEAYSRLLSAGYTFGHGTCYRRDPFYLELSNVSPGAHIEVLNLSRNPEASWANAVTLPGDSAGLSSGQNFAVEMSDTEAIKYGILPGDVLVFRQVDGNGGVSAPGCTQLNNFARTNGTAEMTVGTALVQAFDCTAVEAGKRYTIDVQPDVRAPVGVGSVRTLTAADGSMQVAGTVRAEPGAALELREKASGQTLWSATSDGEAAALQVSIPSGKTGADYVVVCRDLAGNESTLPVA